MYFRFYTDWYRSVSCVRNLDNFKGCVDEENALELSVYHGKNLVKINYQKPKKLVAPFDRGKSLGLLLFKKE